MSSYVPLFQAMVWPALLAVLLYLNRTSLARVMDAVVCRIEAGAPVKAGPVELGSAPALPPVPREEDSRQIDQLPHDWYLSHSARRDPSLDRGGQLYYRVRIYVDAESPEQLQEVMEVVYHLHPTFQDPVRRVKDPARNFELQTIAWGEFNMTAEIKIRNRPTLIVERYINLPAPDAG